jgi:dynein heavy chain 2
VWTVEFNNIRTKLRDSLKVCEKWIAMLSDLTKNYWRNARKWAGKVNSDSLLTLTLRIEEILTLRTQHDELLRLLTEDEQNRLNVSSAFAPFREVNVFYVNVYTMP